MAFTEEQRINTLLGSCSLWRSLPAETKDKFFAAVPQLKSQAWLKDELTDTTKVEVKIRTDQSAKMDKKDINKIEHLGDAGPAKGEKGLDDVVVCKSSSQSTAKK